MLQKKLDESTLDVIAVTLRRNPMCKLMLEDVQVIFVVLSSRSGFPSISFIDSYHLFKISIWQIACKQQTILYDFI